MRHCLPAPSLTRDNAFKTRAEIETNCYTRGYHPLWLSCEVYPFSQEAPYKDLCAAAQRRYSDFSNTVPRKCRIWRDNRGGIREMHVKKESLNRRLHLISVSDRIPGTGFYSRVYYYQQACLSHGRKASSCLEKTDFY